LSFADPEVEAAFQRTREPWMTTCGPLCSLVGAAISLLVVALSARSTSDAARCHQKNALLNFGLFAGLRHFLRSSVMQGLLHLQMVAFSGLVLHLVVVLGLASEEVANILRLERTPDMRGEWSEADGTVLANGVLILFVLLGGFPLSWNLVIVHLGVVPLGMARLFAALVDPQRGELSFCGACAKLRVVIEVYGFALLALLVRVKQERQERMDYLRLDYLVAQQSEPLPGQTSRNLWLSQNQDRVDEVSCQLPPRTDCDVELPLLDSPDVLDDELIPVSREASESWSAVNAKRPSTAPHPPKHWVVNVFSQTTADAEANPPNPVLVAAMGKATPAWSKIRHIADHIRNESYSLQEYFNDCITAFPELQLFFVLEGCSEGEKTASSARPNEVEYQRTVGGLFAVYWMMRLDMDGRAGFCYGVDSEWKTLNRKMVQANARSGSKSNAPRGPAAAGPMSEEQKRASFFETMDWKLFEDLVTQSSCDKNAPNARDRIMALVVLTAIHDIMKVEALLPIVQQEHAPYLGYNAGVVIRDHDIALAYVMEHFSQYLPSYAGLPAQARNSILFTQGKLSFNHGWFVQAEGPPGAMLTAFKKVITSTTTVADTHDIGFYFLHWLTDLAGAEATPMLGVEKLVVKFPQAVLAAFLWSIRFLGKLSKMSETKVVETYLAARWRVMAPSEPVPTDAAAICRMRLVVMAQADGTISGIFDTLPDKDKTVLMNELSRTGCRGQFYSMCEVFYGGPAMLVYYGPALLQKNISSLVLARAALQVLAEVYHVARQLWPLQTEEQDQVVTIQISELKQQTLDKVLGVNLESNGTDPEMEAITESTDALEEKEWVIVRHNNLEGSVQVRTKTPSETMQRRSSEPTGADSTPAAAKPRRQISEPSRAEAGPISKVLDFSHVFSKEHPDVAMGGMALEKIISGTSTFSEDFGLLDDDDVQNDVYRILSRRLTCPPPTSQGEHEPGLAAQSCDLTKLGSEPTMGTRGHWNAEDTRKGRSKSPMPIGSTLRKDSGSAVSGASSGKEKARMISTPEDELKSQIEMLTKEKRRSPEPTEVTPRLATRTLANLASMSSNRELSKNEFTRMALPGAPQPHKRTGSASAASSSHCGMTTLPFCDEMEDADAMMDSGQLASLREENWLLRDQMATMRDEVSRLRMRLQTMYDEEDTTCSLVGHTMSESSRVCQVGGGPRYHRRDFVSNIDAGDGD